MVPPPVYNKINHDGVNQTTVNSFYPNIYKQVLKETGIPKSRFVNLNEELGGDSLSMKSFFNTTDFVHPDVHG